MNKPVIICVDDEITVRDSLRRELSKALEDKFDIETALGGIEALELVEELLDEGCDIAIAIADYFIPDLKGDEDSTRRCGREKMSILFSDISDFTKLSE